jgi:serine/threonine protein phosphatase PrpC
VPDAAIGAIVGAAEGDMTAAANSLVATALNSGGHDNVTVVLAKNDQPAEARQSAVPDTV